MMLFIAPVLPSETDPDQCLGTCISLVAAFRILSHVQSIKTRCSSLWKLNW